MTGSAWVQVLLYLACLAALVKPLGSFMARVFQGERTFLSPLVIPLERLLYRIGRVKPSDEMDWKAYAVSFLLFNLAGLIMVYLLQRVQQVLPFNPLRLGPVPPDLAFNTAASFATNTNWQSYSGETTMSYLTQMLGLAVQNFLSAACGIAVLIALIRGFVRRSTSLIGNFWVDITRGVLYVLLPLSLILGVVLVSQGVVQSFSGARHTALLQPTASAEGAAVASAEVPLGPAASQIAIKQLGTNGGGFFNVNSSHPLENPTPFSGFLEMLAILIIPTALCYTFGKMVGDTRQGWAILSAMTLIFLACLCIVIGSEMGGNSRLDSLGVDQSSSSIQPGGNMEGKEVRFGPVNSAIWATATTSASNGSVNSMHDSYTPLGGLAPMWLMQLGEVVYGGVGSGLYGMLAFVIIAVFVAGLMVGRSPEYLGKKLEAFEMKMASLMVLIPIGLVLAGAALAVAVPAGQSAVFNPGPHAFSEILYAFSSAANNNGSAFAGLSTNNLFYNLALGIVMLVSRYWLAIPALAIAGSLASKKTVPASSGTLPTHNALFVFWLVAVTVLVGALSFFPALSLGPIVEQLIAR
jgi:potassium-transporting ATPase potassium-binding subunit